MAKRFTNSGRLRIPVTEKIQIPENRVEKRGGGLVVREAYCQNGHSLICETRIDGERGIHFIYASPDSSQEADIVISAFVGKCKKKILGGEAFAKGAVVRILCPSCRAELPILMDCECEAPIYIFYIDSRLDHNYAQSVCGRIGCVRSSQLRFSGDALREFLRKHGF